MFQQFGLIEILLIAGFIILFLGFIVLFRLAGVLKKTNAPKATETPAIKAPLPAAVSAAKPQAAKKTDHALIAVLTAAVAAYMGTAPGNLEVKSYRRLKNAKPSWSKAGRHDIMKNHI